MMINIFTITKFIIEYTQHHMEKNLNYKKRWWEKKRKQIKISIEQKKRNKKQNRREQKRIERKRTKQLNQNRTKWNKAEVKHDGIVPITHPSPTVQTKNPVELGPPKWQPEPVRDRALLSAKGDAGTLEPAIAVGDTKMNIA